MRLVIVVKAHVESFLTERKLCSLAVNLSQARRFFSLSFCGSGANLSDPGNCISVEEGSLSLSLSRISSGLHLPHMLS